MYEWYNWSSYKPRKATKKQIQEMINNMQKTWIISEKSKQYHEQEERDAENILKKFGKNE